MRRIITILLIITSAQANAQSFPSTDSLRNFIDRWIRNSAIQSYTNLRLNTALKGIVNEIDSVAENAGGTDTTSLSNRIDAKQDALISGTNIRTVNNASLLGSGNINIAFDTTDLFTDYQDAINERVKYSDTSNIFSAYLTALLGRVRYTDTADMLGDYQSGISSKQPQLSGTGFVKASGTTISYDNNSYSLSDHTHAFSEITSTTNVALKNTDNNFSANQTVNAASATITLKPTLNSQTVSLNMVNIDGGVRGGITTNINTGEVRLGALGSGGYFPSFYSNGAEAGRISTTGNLGIGTGSTVSARIHAISTTEQFRQGYNASNYMSVTTGSTGNTTFDLTGTTPKFIFGKSIQATAYGSGFAKFDGSGNISSATIEQSDVNGLTAALDEKVSYADTAAVLEDYQTAINERVKYTDTAAMLAAYQNLLAVTPRRVLVNNGATNTGTTSETEIYRDTIKTSVYPFKANSSLHIPFVLNGNSTANQKIFRLKINGTTVITVTRAATNLTTYRAYFWISNKNSLTSQVTAGVGSGITTASGGWAAGQTASPTTYSFDTNQDLIITCTSQLANAGDSETVEQMDIIQYP